MKEKFISLLSATGKQIKEIKQTSFRDDIFIFFKDGTWSLIQGQHERDCDDYDHVYSYPQIAKSAPDNHYRYISYGIITQEEAESIRKKIELDNEKTKQAFRYQEYLRLKKEFDAEPGSGI
jgi:hypothetical protein